MTFQILPRLGTGKELVVMLLTYIEEGAVPPFGETYFQLFLLTLFTFTSRVQYLVHLLGLLPALNNALSLRDTLTKYS